MKVLSRTIFSILFAGLCMSSSSQSIGRHSIGLQLNPYIDESLFTNTFIKPVYAFRYTLGINEHITIGPELSGFHTKAHVNDYSFGSFNAGGFFRYSFLPVSRIKPFVELSSYYTNHYWKNGPEDSFPGVEPNGSISSVSGYIAPGISLFSKSGKVSLDLFYKFSNKTFVNAKQSVLSYRLNFKF